jgi:hypothetical protein
MKKLPIDKQAHFFAGAAIASTITLYGGNAVWGLVVCVVAAIGKELYDATGRGTLDVWDAVATILGGAVVLPLL